MKSKEVGKQATRHFTLRQLADGVYAAIHQERGWAVSNAGLVDLGGETLLFDTFMTPAAAQELRQVAEELMQQPVTYVVNSHYHNDHIWGNQVFRANTEIISTSARPRFCSSNTGMSAKELCSRLRRIKRSFQFNAM